MMTQDTNLFSHIIEVYYDVPEGSNYPFIMVRMAIDKPTNNKELLPKDKFMSYLAIINTKEISSLRDVASIKEYLQLGDYNIPFRQINLVSADDISAINEKINMDNASRNIIINSASLAVKAFLVERPDCFMMVERTLGKEGDKAHQTPHVNEIYGTIVPVSKEDFTGFYPIFYISDVIRFSDKVRQIATDSLKGVHGEFLALHREYLRKMTDRHSELLDTIDKASTKLTHHCNIVSDSFSNTTNTNIYKTETLRKISDTLGQMTALAKVIDEMAASLIRKC
jgi:hypothetical protein